MTLQYALLGLLSYQSMTGYELKKLFDESISNFWYASLSQIYRELAALEKKGLLTSAIQQQSDRPDKKIYSITEDGRQVFQNWIRNFPEKLSKEKRDEFTLRIFFGANLSSQELEAEFKRFRKEKEGQLEEIKALHLLSGKLTEQLNLFHGEERYWKFVLRRAELSLKMLSQWADECLEELERDERANSRGDCNRGIESEHLGEDINADKG